MGQGEELEKRSRYSDNSSKNYRRKINNLFPLKRFLQKRWEGGFSTGDYFPQDFSKGGYSTIDDRIPALYSRYHGPRNSVADTPLCLIYIEEFCSREVSINASATYFLSFQEADKYY